MGVLRTVTPDELKKIIEAHAKWRRGEPDGARAYLADAYLAGANLSETTVLPTGESWKAYLEIVVPALLVADGRELAKVATEKHWTCHDWANCPMAAAFGVHDEHLIPLLHQPRARQFIQLFDAKLIPLLALPVAPVADQATAAAENKGE